MPPVRWLGTTAAMAVVAWGLLSLGPTPDEARAAAADPQGLVDRAGADALVLVVVAALAWSVWTWGAVGLLLTATSTVPGATGRLAGRVLTCVLPLAARRAAAVALGVGLSTVAPLALPSVTTPVAVAAAADGGDGHPLPTPGVDVDWPTPSPVPVPGPPPTAPPVAEPPASGWPAPDWPAPAPAPAPPPDAHVVLRGDCLWDIAADRLQRQSPGRSVPAAEVQRAVQAWWQANAAVIGPDPDLLLPGQVLRPPP